MSATNDASDNTSVGVCLSVTSTIIKLLNIFLQLCQHLLITIRSQGDRS